LRLIRDKPVSDIGFLCLKELATELDGEFFSFLNSFIQTIPHASHRGDQAGRGRSFQFAAQMADIDLQGIGGRCTIFNSGAQGVP
jgi:hypothetical protein